MTRVKEISAMDIPDYKFEGYYWYSDQASPVVIIDERVEQKIFTDLPFIVEANFYARKENTSISVKHIDGKYLIFKFDLNDLETNKHSVVKYIGHDLQSKDYLMVESWKEVEDELQLLEGMKTLTPGWSAFMGFVNN